MQTWFIHTIGHVNEYPTTHYFGNPRHTQSMVAYMILTEYVWKFQWKIVLWECCWHALLHYYMKNKLHGFRMPAYHHTAFRSTLRHESLCLLLISVYYACTRSIYLVNITPRQFSVWNGECAEWHITTFQHSRNALTLVAASVKKKFQWTPYSDVCSW